MSSPLVLAVALFLLAPSFSESLSDEDLCELRDRIEDLLPATAANEKEEREKLVAEVLCEVADLGKTSVRQKREKRSTSEEHSSSSSEESSESREETSDSKSERKRRSIHSQSHKCVSGGHVDLECLIESVLNDPPEDCDYALYEKSIRICT